MLANEGIHSQVTHVDSSFPGMAFMQNSGVCLVVNDEDYDAARKILESVDFDDLEIDEAELEAQAEAAAGDEEV